MSITMEYLKKVVQRAINEELENTFNKHLNDTIEFLRASIEKFPNIAKSALKQAEEQKAIIKDNKTSIQWTPGKRRNFLIKNDFSTKKI